MSTTHRIGTSVALALALAASAAPAGARQIDLNANGSDVPAGLASMQAPSQSAAPLTMHPTALKDHQHGTVLGGLLRRRLRLAIRAPGSDAHEHRAGFRCLKHQSL